MAFTYGFYNSKNKDRRYNADQMSQLFDGILNDGVFNKVGELMMVVPGTGLQVLVKSGRAWFNSTWSYNDAAYPLNLSTPDVTVPRIDAVVLEVDHTETVRRNRLLVVKGIAASNPEKPILVNTDLIHQHPLAYVTLRAGAESISSGDIEIMVGKDECPFVTGILETASLEDLFAAWDEQFTTWFDDIKSQLDGDVVTNLLNEINKRVKIEDKASQSEAQGLSDDTKWMTPLKTKYAVSKHPDVGKIRVDGGGSLSDVTSVGNFFLVEAYSQNGPVSVSPNKQYAAVCTDTVLYLCSLNPFRQIATKSGSFGSGEGVIITDSYILVITVNAKFYLYRYTSSSITPIVENASTGTITTMQSSATWQIFTTTNIAYFIALGRNSSSNPVFQRINLSTGAVDNVSGSITIGYNAVSTVPIGSHPLIDSSGNFYYFVQYKGRYNDTYDTIDLYKITPSGSSSKILTLTTSEQLPSGYELHSFLANNKIYLYHVNVSSSNKVEGKYYRISLSGSKEFSTTISTVNYEIRTWKFLVNGSQVSLGSDAGFPAISITNGNIGSKMTEYSYVKSSFKISETPMYAFSFDKRYLMPRGAVSQLGTTLIGSDYIIDGNRSKLFLGG